MHSNSTELLHLGLRRWCSACDDAIADDETTVARKSEYPILSLEAVAVAKEAAGPLLVLGYDKASSCCTLTQPFPFPPAGPSARMTDGFLLCLRAACRCCAASSPEAAAVHHQCLTIFIDECLRQKCHLSPSQALGHLRDIVFYRRPWYKACHLYDRPLSSEAEQYVLSKIADTSDLAGLRYLPAEIVHMIRQFSSGTWLWRFMSVWDLARRATVSAQPLQISALGTIQRWTRGDSAAVLSTSNDQPIVKITIDSFGIQSIVRLSERPSFRPSVSQHQSYVVDEVTEFSGVQACSKVRSGSSRCPCRSTKILTSPRVVSSVYGCHRIRRL